MIKVSELRATIQALIKSIHSTVYYQVAPNNAKMPYVVFDFTNSIDFGSLENFVMDIDVWDDKTDTTELETIISNIDDALHKKSFFLNEKMGFVIYRDNRLTLTDEDNRIRRRKNIYQVRTYQKYYC